MAQTSGLDPATPVLTARCLTSLIWLLASMEKMVPEGRLHMRPFQFHLKEHWRFPRPLDTHLPWTETISALLEWWQNPTNVMKGADLRVNNKGSRTSATVVVYINQQGRTRGWRCAFSCVRS